MRRLWHLASANLRKNKEQAVSFFFMVLLAAVLMNLGLVTALNYNKNFDRRAEELNAADVIMTVQKRDTDFLEEYGEKLLEDKRTSKLEVRPVLFLSGKCEYGGSEITKMLAVLNASKEHDMGKISYVERTKEKVENPIYLPYIFKTGGGYKLGDKFRLAIQTNGLKEQSFSYTVSGFFEENMLGTINSGMTGLILKDAEYEKLSQEYSGGLDALMYSVQLKEKSENEVFYSENLPELSAQEIPFIGIYYDIIKQSRTLTSSIGAILIVAFSVIVVGIALIVVKFRIGNSIEEDMKNIGALKAMGYTGRQVAGSILLQFLLVAILGAVSGIAASYGVLPAISGMFAAQTGVIWKQGFDVISACITCVMILFAVCTVALLSAQKARRLQPIAALRSGMLTHSFRWNPFPLEKRGNLIMRLSAKSFCQNIKRNILVGIIVSAIGFAASFAGVMYYNIDIKFENFISGMVGEIYRAEMRAPDSRTAEALLDEVKEMLQVRKAIYYYNDAAVQSREGKQISAYITEDFSQFDNKDILYQGRFPKYENETAIGGLLAGQLGKKTGDTIMLVRDNRETEYLITGLIQGSNFLGRDAALTGRGYQRLVPDYTPVSLAVYLEEGEDIDRFLEDVGEEFGDNILSSRNYKKMVEASMGTYRNIVGTLAVVIFAVTAFIIALTMYLVVKAAVLRKKREFGIQKAIGYTTIQLVMQTSFSILPVILLGALAGVLGGKILINPMLSVLFSGIGVMKVHFQIPMQMLLGFAGGITLFGFLVSVLVSGNIKKITPYALMSE